jgi:hypothetical protein
MLRRQIGHAQHDYEVRNDLDLCADILRTGALAHTVESQIGPIG